MRILVTGGAGYIGSHTVVELLVAGHNVVVLDNYCNSAPVALQRVSDIVEQATGAQASLTTIEGDIRDRALLDQLFEEHAIDAVIHFAGLKAVGESVDKPLEYYENNVGGTVTLCQAMDAAGVTRLVFSSSATVYGEDAPVPYVETLPRGRTSNPYGTSKAMVEQVLTDLCRANSRWSVALLRYFNPIGAHPSGLIGEDPQGIPNNLMPYIAQVAIGRRSELSIFGDDYDTPDGTCQRDYLHVVDLAIGHLKALRALNEPSVKAYNLGTGRACSVMEMVQAFEKASGRKIAYRIAPRRAGDLPAFWANPSKAAQELNWQAKRSLEEMMADTWRWQSTNPNGYHG
ncbi:MAG: UDP-glucose 4-epimerase GalE [Oceanospirillaceae bacterium]|nr:UDP-glucose 4-epimerase GalE [Oceanospirillaceae bacterium]